MDGRMFVGVALLARAGLVALIALAVVVPPLIAAFFGWLTEEWTGVAPLTVYIWAQGIWVLVMVACFASGWIVDKVRARRQQREHEEFMRLRDMFYARSDICVESLASLRRRAAPC